MVLVDANSEECGPKVEKQTLMEKYRIPVQHFEYSYIENCNNGRELEKIVQVLKSGEEGYFPDLTRFAEDRLAIVKPKSKLLKKVCPVLSKEALSREERKELTNDITQWVANVSRDDDELTLYKNRKCERELPEVRKTNKEIVEEKKKEPSKRILSMNYDLWDKYDPDTEILKMDLEEENLKKAIAEKQKKKSTVKKTVQFKEHTSDIEALHEANYEKDKGNEFFKAGDYKEALRHYTNSINCKPILASYTNRALTNIKLKNYKNAIDDCHSALAIDPDNIKALVRKAQALDGLKRYQEALETAEQAIEVDPNNTTVQDLAEKLQKRCGIVFKNTRFKVEDVYSDKVIESKKSTKNMKTEKTIIPIPGTSNMSPPYYITYSENNPRKVKEEAVRANTPTQIIHLLPSDSSDVEDDDCCTVNHLKEICSSGTSGDESIKICKNHCSENNDQQKNNLNTNEHQSEEIVNENYHEMLQDDINREKPIKDVMIEEDHHAGGEPCIKANESVEMPEDIHSPYSFLKTWNSANIDETLEQHASILRSIDMNRIVDVIGCKLDNAMFSKIVKCLCTHFAVPGEVDRLHSILDNIVNLPRFDIIAMLMSSEDRKCVNTLVNFLKQHGKSLSEDVVNKFFNNYWAYLISHDGPDHPGAQMHLPYALSHVP